MFSDEFNSYQSLFRSQQVRANTLFSTLTQWHHLWDRKCSWSCNVFHSTETLLSAGLVSAPCSVDLQQYACSSVRRPPAEHSFKMSWYWWCSGSLRPSREQMCSSFWNHHDISWTVISTDETLCVRSSQASLLKTWQDFWSANSPAAAVTPRRSGSCFSPKQTMFSMEPSPSSPARQQIW